MIELDHGSPLPQIGAVIDDLRRSPGGSDELAALLPERSPLYQGRSAAEVSQIRGYLLAAFADTGLPATAMPFARESLLSGDTAYEVAGAAIGLRGLPDPPDDLAHCLLQSIENLPEADRTISVESIDARWPYRHPTTALTEILLTIRHLGVLARPVRMDLENLEQQPDRFSAAVLADIRLTLDAVRSAAPDDVDDGGADDGCAGCSGNCPGCCAPGPARADRDEPAAAGVILQDQHGQFQTFDEYYCGTSSLVAFFYTRCDNPYKCTLTVSKLAAIQAALDRRGFGNNHPGRPIRITAISYDPDFDLPHRLLRYGSDRGIRFDENTRFFRATSGFADLRERFGLGVNYGGSTVNRHQIELYVLDAAGRPVASFTRVQWEVDAVLATVEAVHAGEFSAVR